MLILRNSNNSCLFLDSMYIAIFNYDNNYFEGLGNHLFNYLSSFQRISFSPYIIPAVLGIAGFSLILYDFVNKRRYKRRQDDDENGDIFQPIHLN